MDILLTNEKDMNRKHILDNDETIDHGTNNTDQHQLKEKSALIEKYSFT